MKLPTPVKLPSGSWRVQLMVGGHRVSRTFGTEREAVRWAAEAKTTEKEIRRNPASMTVETAVERYIDSKSEILSPSTIKGYRTIQHQHMSSIERSRIGNLSQERIQRWVNGLARNHSPKTVMNAHGLLSAVLREYEPDMVLHTRLPQKEKAEIKIPSQEELSAVIAAARGTRMELPILLAATMGLRRSEILGLEWQDVDGDYLHVRRAVVMGSDGEVEKGTKTYSGKRAIKLTSQVRDALEGREHDGDHDHIVPMTGKMIYDGFTKLCRAAGVPHYRFHDLRHFYASALMASGVPDKTAMQRMGHATTNMLHNVYQHTIKEKEREYDDSIDDYFNGII